MIYIRRKRRAFKLGIPFVRRHNFIMPQYLTIHGVKKEICVPHEEGYKSMFTEVLLDDEYCLELFKHENIKTIIDIGANIGLFSIWARTIFPNSIIHAYEPDPAMQHCLQKNAAIYNFSVFPEAVGRHAGRVRMDGRMRVQMEDSADITQVAFDSCIARMGGEVSLLKMDIEGAEWDFLEDREAWESVRYVAMEYHLWPGKHSVEEVNEKIQRLGFRIVNLKPLSKYTGMLLALRG